MAKLNRILFILFILVAIKSGVAQIIFEDQESVVEPTKHVDQKVKNLLLSKFASIDYEIGRTLNDMKKQITSDLEYKLLLNVNNRISKMEDEIRIMKEKCSLKENSEQELITNITDTLHSKINLSLKEMDLSYNVSYNSIEEKMSKLTKNLKIKLDRLEPKVAELENNVSILHSEFKDKLNTSQEIFQMITNKSEHVLQESYAFAVNHSARMKQQLETYFNESVSSSLKNITNLIQITNDRLDLESFNNSVTMSSFKQKMQDLQTEKKELIANTTETLDSKIHAKFLETSLAINKSLVLVDRNMSSLAESMKVKIDRWESKIAEIGQNVSISQSNSQEEFNNSLTSVRMEIITKEESLQRSVSMAVNNSLQMIQELEIYFNEKLSSTLNNITKLIQITNDRLDLESFNNSVTMSSFEQKMRDLQTEERELIANTTETLDSKIHAKFLETTITMNKSVVLVDRKMSSLAESIKVKIDRWESKIAEIGQNVSISQSNSQEEFNNSLTSVQMEIMTKEESLQRSVSMAVNNSLRMIQELEAYFNDQFSSYVKNFTKMIQFTDKRVELESYHNNSTMFSLEEKINTLQKEKVNLEDELMKAKTNLSVLNRQGIVKWQVIQYQLNENYQQVSTLINETRKDQEKMVHEFAKNLSDVLALQQDVFQNVSVISAEVKNLGLKTILDIENQGMETNKTAEQVLRFEFNLNSCNSRIETLEKYQNVLSEQNNITIEKMELIEGNMSTWNRQLQTAIDLHNDAKALKNITILELNRVMLNISNIRDTIRGFETYHANQNSRLGTIERRQTNISSSLSDIKTTLNYAGIIRLSNGGRYYGRIEVYYNGAWGTVCDDSWDSYDAYVACRMLGLSGGTAKSSASYGQGSGSIWLDDLQCSGSESSLFACIHQPVGSHNCGHSEDAGVICS